MTRDIDHLAGDEMLGADRRTDRKQRSLAVDAEFSDLLLERHLRLGEVLALRFGDVLLLGLAAADLERDVAVAIGGAVRDHLAIFQRQDGDRHVAAVLLEQAGHPDFLRDHAGAHDQAPYNRGTRDDSRVLASPNCRASPRPG
ncbi:hypothetical protein D3C83_22230 [compost metagenome]